MKLTEAIDLVKDATAKQDLLPILQCLCFENQKVFAYDDKMAIEAECPIEIEGAIPAEKFSAFVKSFSEDSIEIENGANETVLIKSGKSKIELPCKSVDAFIFEMPDESYYEYSFEFGERFITGLKECLRSVSSSYLLPVFSGITVEIESGICYIHSCESDSISRFTFPIKAEDYQKFILDGKFCKSLIAAFDKSKSKKGILNLAEDSALAKLENCTMYVKLPTEIQHDIREKFEDIDRSCTDYLDIPEEFIPLIDRSILALGKEGVCRLVLGKDNIQVLTLPSDNKNISIIIEESIEIDNDREIEVLVNPNLLKKILPFCDEMSINEEAIVAKGERYGALISTFN